MSQPDFAFQRVAIVNRGEPAMRLINAVREWNAERPARATVERARVECDHEHVAGRAIAGGRAGLPGPHDGFGRHVRPGVAVRRQRQQACRRRGRGERVGAQHVRIGVRRARGD